jgi:formylglycine-generating enzyme required for sulfatase activity
MSDHFDPYHRWLGIPPEDQPPNHYRLLGLNPSESDREVIRDAADRQMAHVRTYQLGPHSALSQRVLNELGAAAACLLDPQKKAAYDATLRPKTKAARRPPGPSAGAALPAVSPKKKVLAVGAGLGLVGILGVVLLVLSVRHRDVKETVVPATVVVPEKPAQTPIYAKEQRQCAERLGIPVELKNSIGMPLVLIPPGEFEMGSTREEIARVLADGANRKESPWCLDAVPTEAPRHRVRITKPFYAGVYQVTQAEYEKVMGVNPSAFTEKQMDASAFKPPLGEADVQYRVHGRKAMAGKDTSRHPVETVSWGDCVEFCRRLSEMPGERAARRVYRLPTEAEWEYACRAGTTTRWYSGDEDAGLIDIAWVRTHAGGVTHTVGEKKPNAWGLFDMLGNLNQWCADWYSKDYYAQSTLNDPTGPAAGSARVTRGNDWLHATTLCRPAYRGRLGPAYRNSWGGFRVAVDAGLPPSARIEQPAQREPRTTQSTTGSPTEPPLAKPKMDAVEAALVQKQWAEHLGVKAHETNSLGMPLALIPPGEFMMGSTPEENAWAVADGKKKKQQQWYFDLVPAERPRHRVRITRPYYLGMYQVTQAEYEKVMGVNPSDFTAKQMEPSAFQPPLSAAEAKFRLGDREKMAGKDTSRHPVETVSWDQAMEFCRRLAAMPAERAAQRVYRLPTEAEWEYACRAGTTTRWYSGDDPAGLSDVAWFGQIGGASTQPVGGKKPNAWGLYDMHGNVQQWCADWFGADYYQQSPASDPTGPSAGSSRVVRGGDWMRYPNTCRSARRDVGSSVARGSHTGFRVAMEIASQPPAAGAAASAAAETPAATPSPPPSASPAAKQPPPNEAEQEKALKAAQERIKPQWQRAETRAEKSALAKQLLQQAIKGQDDAAGRFALFELARDVAAEAGDWDLVRGAVNAQAEAFVVERLQIAASILADWAKRPQNPAQRSDLVEKIIKLFDEALDAPDLTAADALCKLAVSEAPKTHSRMLVQRAQNCKKRLAEDVRTQEALTKAQAALAANPHDADANLAVGRQLCLAKGDWDQGLPMLARGSDDALRALAQQELAMPGTGPGGQGSPSHPQSPIPDPLQLADAWWNVALAATGTQKERLMLHAGRWYAHAAEDSPVGPEGKKIEKRLLEIAKIRARLPGPPPAIAPFDGKQAKQYQRRWADYLGKPVETANSIGMKLVLIPAGEFMMGSTPEESAAASGDGRTKSSAEKSYFNRVLPEAPRHRVRVTRPFYLGVFQVTQGEYEKVMGVNPSNFAARQMEPSGFIPPLSPSQVEERGQDFNKIAREDTSRHPVETVSWLEATEFCHRLSAMPAEQAARRVYRLPTEAEWEYACRAGTTTRWYCGDDAAGVVDVAWFGENAHGMTHPVGQKKPNAWGLYDMHGNVWQWCADWFGANYYEQSPLSDPIGPPVGTGHVLRGGYWWFSASACRSASRLTLVPASRNRNDGFRVVVGH